MRAPWMQTGEYDVPLESAADLRWWQAWQSPCRLDMDQGGPPALMGWMWSATVDRARLQRRQTGSRLRTRSRSLRQRCVW